MSVAVMTHVAGAMTANPVTIHKQATLSEALALMQSMECHHLPVTGNDNTVIGILTDGDCYRAMGKLAADNDWQGDADAQRLRVGQAMTSAPIVVEPDSPLSTAVELMLRHHISCVLVMRSESLVGILTTFDILYTYLRISPDME
jgi:CBS domain-containing protein